MDALWSRFDVLVTPTVPMGPPPLDVDELDVRERAISLTFAFNAVGAPALALGSVQIAAAPREDALVLAAGELIERAAAR
jgi:Asp-tRNA(Asn)/Glu-tRNA(Gln) amidotransferase A subunit family amidase